MKAAWTLFSFAVMLGAIYGMITALAADNYAKACFNLLIVESVGRSMKEKP